MADTSRNKEEQYSNILSDFVACTGIQDEGQAIQYLENVNWDLLAAINLVMPQHSQRLPSEAASSLLSNTSSDVEMITIPGDSPIRNITFTNPNASIITIAPDDEEMPPSSSSSSHSRSKQLQFVVMYDKSAVSIGLPETKTVYDLKQEIFTKTGLQVCKQLVKGWPDNELIVNDKITLASLRLPSVVHLTVDTAASLPSSSSTNGHASSSSSSASTGFNNSKKKRATEASDSSRLYKLNIADLTNSREYHLKYGGNTKVAAVKQDVETLSKIPPSQQVWTGWWDADDSDEERDGDRASRQSKEDRDRLPLHKTGISYPNHDLTVEAASGSVPSSNNKSVIDLADTDSSMDEYEDAACFTEEEDNTVAEILTTRRNLQALMPENIEDETSAVLHFIQQFETRYGAARPHFFPGTLDQAIKEACFQPAKERKILVVYLHHDASVLSNVFCSQLLCFESVLQFLTTNCVIWPWDLTHKKNRTRLLSSATASLGQVAGRLLSSHMDVDRLPLLLLISRLRGATEIFSVMDGNTGVNDLMSSLLGAQEMFAEQMRSEAREESEREERELIKNQQDEAYQQSLAVDRAKEESKRLAEQMEIEARVRLESEQMAQAHKKATTKAHLAEILPEEPPAQSEQPVITVRFRLPALPAAENGAAGESATAATGKGGAKIRRFYASQPVQDIVNYLIVEGYDADEYKTFFGWPRKEISPDISHQTLAELKFAAQETLIVEER